MFASLPFRKRINLNALRLTISALLFIALSSCDSEKPAPLEFTSGDIPQEVYLWQRVWTDEVKSAVENRAPEFQHTVFLAAEISFQDEKWTCQPFNDPLQHARKHPGEFGLAFRIHADAATSQWTETSTQQVSRFLRQYASDAKSIQIDYDCPSKKLADYTKLLLHLREEFPDRPLEITCLPDWLNSPDFPELIQQTDRYIMQVHGVSGHGKGRALCHPDHAHRTALACARLNQPFLIALPTYRHAINYDKEGKPVSVASEGHYQKATYEVVKADPIQLSQLIRDWQKQRPALMEGVIWYRLPVSTDRMNWTWNTFQKVRRGTPLEVAKLKFSILPDSQGLYRLEMKNNSEQRIDWPETIRLDWQGFCIASQLETNFTQKEFERGRGITISWKKNSPFPIAPQESIPIGSFRFNETPSNLVISTP